MFALESKNGMKSKYKLPPLKARKKNIKVNPKQIEESK